MGAAYAKDKRVTAMASSRDGVGGRLAAPLFRVLCCRGTQCTIWPSGVGVLPRGEHVRLRCPLVVIGHVAEIRGGCLSMLLLLLSLLAAAQSPLTIIV